MTSFAVVAIPKETARAVRTTLRSPGYGHPAHVEVATGHGPCRLCLHTFQVGRDRRILFTYDPFTDVAPYPRPGPVFIHEEECDPYPEDGGFPEDLKERALTLEAYGPAGAVLAQEHVEGAAVEGALDRLLSRPDVFYVHVLDTEAGCYDLRVLRQGATWKRIPFR